MISTDYVDNPDNWIIHSGRMQLEHGITLLLVDGLNLIRRIHAAQQNLDKLSLTVLHSIQRGVREVAASHLLLVMDGAGTTWRHRLYPGYKQGRKPMPEDLRSFLPGLLSELERSGIRWVSEDGVEADDLIVTAVSRLSNHDLKMVVLSTDKGFLPLISQQVSVRDHFQHCMYSAEDVRQRFGVSPGLLRDYWALAGDSSNHIPGVSGIGNKMAARLLSHYGTLSNVLAEADQVEGAAGEHLRQQKSDVMLYRQLFEPGAQLALSMNLQQCRVPGNWLAERL